MAVAATATAGVTRRSAGASAEPSMMAVLAGSISSQHGGSLSPVGARPNHVSSPIDTLRAYSSRPARVTLVAAYAGGSSR